MENLRFEIFELQPIIVSLVEQPLGSVEITQLLGNVGIIQQLGSWEAVL